MFWYEKETKERNHVSKSMDCFEQLTIDTIQYESKEYDFRHKIWMKEIKTNLCISKMKRRILPLTNNDENKRILSLQDTEFNFVKSTSKTTYNFSSFHTFIQDEMKGGRYSTMYTITNMRYMQIFQSFDLGWFDKFVLYLVGWHVEQNNCEQRTPPKTLHFQIKYVHYKCTLHFDCVIVFSFSVIFFFSFPEIKDFWSTFSIRDSDNFS